MKILILANKFPYPPRDGGVIAKLAMIKGFYNAGCDLTVNAINTSKHYTDPASLPADIAKLAIFNDTYVDTEIRLKGTLKNFLFSKIPYTAERFINASFENQLQRTLQKETFDVVQIEGLYMCAYIPIIRKYSKALISYRAHNIEYEIWERTAGNAKNPLKKLYLYNLAKRTKRWEKKQLNLYDVLVPISDKDSEGLNKEGNKKSAFVCQTGIEPDAYPPVENTYRELSLFHLGGLDWAPNQQGIVWFIDNCWAQIVANFPGIQLNIGGRNAPEWFERKCKSTPNIVFHGEVDSAREFFGANAIMIVPLLAGSGMRIKIIEGMAMGKAIVSTSIGAEGIEAGHGRDIIIADDAIAFVNEISELLKNRSRIEDIGKNAITFVHENFNNNTITKGLLSFYGDHIADI